MLAACQDDRAVVEVAVSGLTPELTALEVKARIVGQAQLGPFLIQDRLDSFVVKLPADRQGELSLSVGGLSGDGCQVAGGGGALVLSGGARTYATSVALSPFSPRACRIDVIKPEAGLGRVVSVPAGIDCGPTCQGFFPPATGVTLTAQAEPDSYFSEWLGACVGVGPCQITEVGNRALEVRARFLPRETCALPLPALGGKRFCWENPLPQGNAMQAVWGSGPADIWAVGGYGTILRWNGVRWSSFLSGTEQFLSDVWGSGPDDVWAVGTAGTVRRFDGKSWSAVEVPTSKDLGGVWGSGKDDVWIVGVGGTILHYDGVEWRSVRSGVAQSLLRIWGSGRDDVWAGGTAALLRWDGRIWRQVQLPSADRQIWSVWGSGKDDVWFAASTYMAEPARGFLLHHDGQKLREEALEGRLPRAVWGTGPDNVWLGGGDGLVERLRGNAWVPLNSGSRATLNAMWGSDADNIWAVTVSGILLRWNGAFWSISDSSSLTTNFLFGVGGSSAADVWTAGAGGEVLRYGGAGTFAPQQTLATQPLLGLFVASPGEVWISGSGGTLVRYQDRKPTRIATGLSSSLNAIWGNSKGEVWIVGSQGKILRWDGGALSEIPSGTSAALTSIYGTADDDIWIVGEFVILRGDGKTFSRVPLPAVELPAEHFFLGVWGSGPADVWAVGGFGVERALLRWSGGQFVRVTSPGSGALWGVWGDRPGNVWFSGNNGVVLRWDGKSFAQVPSGTTNALFRIWGHGARVWAVGEGGAILSLR